MIFIMKVRVRYLPPLNIKINKNNEIIEFEKEGITIEDLLTKLEEMYGDRIQRNILEKDRNNKYRLTFTRNGKLARAEERLENDDTVTILMALSGG